MKLAKTACPDWWCLGIVNIGKLVKAISEANQETRQYQLHKSTMFPHESFRVVRNFINQLPNNQINNSTIKQHPNNIFT